MFQYLLYISNKICNYVVKLLINSLTTEGELIGQGLLNHKVF